MPKQNSTKLADNPPALREKLLLTSRQLLNESGPDSLSMRAVSRRAGCTHQAPYHYFPNREAILAALVEDGFNELSAALIAAAQSASSLDLDNESAAAARELSLAAAEAYIKFAVTNPGIFRIMFRPDMCNPKHFPAVQKAALKARNSLTELAKKVYGSATTPEHEMLLWAHVHGVASLLNDSELAEKFPTVEAKVAYARKLSEAFAVLP